MSTAPALDPSAKARRRRQLARIVALACLALGLALGLASCTAALDLDAYGNVAEEMCGLLGRCYGEADYAGCRPMLEGHLDGADSDARAAWLYSFTTFGCLESCSAGRHCLNIAPLCAASGACRARQDCCGFLDGNASCVDNTCCRTRGSSCESDAECCDAGVGCQGGVCGGVACRKAEKPCASDDECCTRICKRGACADTICEDENAVCAVDDDCCNHHCDPATRLCTTPPVCAAVGVACAVDATCCPGNVCVSTPGFVGATCQPAACFPLDTDCSEDGQCCSGRCDRAQFFCAAACAAETHECSQDTDCCAGTCVGGVCAGTCSTTFCTESADCCSKSCVDNVCAAACSTPTLHATCVTGGPLANDPAPSACITAICQADPYCCCGAWDDLCVTAAAAQKNLCTDTCN